MRLKYQIWYRYSGKHEEKKPSSDIIFELTEEEKNELEQFLDDPFEFRLIGD